MKSLGGRRLVVTRAAEQADTTVELITSFGAIPIVVPLVEIIDEPDGVAQLAAFDLDEVEWLVVTSPNGARRVAHMVRPDTRQPADRRGGRGDGRLAAALRSCRRQAERGGTARRVPIGFGTSCRRPIGSMLRRRWSMVSRERGWHVTAIKPFRAVTATPSSEANARTRSAADAVLFASGSAARAWVGDLRPAHTADHRGHRRANCCGGRAGGTQDHGRFCRSFDVRDVGRPG